jgi:arylsulfatase
MSNDRPNVVFLFSDQHRGDALGCLGNTAVRTPNLDSLAADGVTFRSCSTSSPFACLPGRHSLPGSMSMNTVSGGIVTRQTVSVRAM